MPSAQTLMLRLHLILLVNSIIHRVEAISGVFDLRVCSLPCNQRHSPYTRCRLPRLHRASSTAGAVRMWMTCSCLRRSHCQEPSEPKVQPCHILCYANKDTRLTVLYCTFRTIGRAIERELLHQQYAILIAIKHAST